MGQRWLACWCKPASPAPPNNHLLSLAWCALTVRSSTSWSSASFDNVNLQDIRPAAITMKIVSKDRDAYDFAAHSNAATTYKHYDRRVLKRATATE